MESVSELRGRFVLIVEDEPLVALDLAEQLSTQGARTVIANSVPEALSALARFKFAVGIVDYRLRDQDASEVIRRLEKLQVPFLMHSGCEEVKAWAGAPIVRKPAPHHHLMQTVLDLLD